MEDPCKKCLVSATCKKYQSECMKLWDYNIFLFKTEMKLNKLIENNKKNRVEYERSKK